MLSYEYFTYEIKTQNYLLQCSGKCDIITYFKYPQKNISPNYVATIGKNIETSEFTLMNVLFIKVCIFIWNLTIEYGEMRKNNT